MAKTPLGRFVWHEILTTDVEGAKRFYGDVVGWTPSAWDHDPSYVIWNAGHGPVGGLAALSADLIGKGVPPHWLCYLGTPNVDESVAKAKGMGGAVTLGPIDIPGVGRFAILEDPAGAVFCLFASDNPSGSDQPRLGDFSWHELATTNPDGALRFYAALVGWEKTGEVDMGPDGKYEMFGLGGIPMGGVYQLREQQPGPYWLPYAKVPSADTATSRASSGGATVVVAPMDVPGGDRIAMMIDPQGALFAVHSSKGN